MENINRSTPTARKEHRCDYCGGVILIGEKYDRQTNVDGGTLWEWKNHISCQEIASKLDMFDWADDGVTEDTFRDQIREEYHQIMQREHEDLYESKEFRMPTFLDQLKFVKEYHLTQKQ